MDFQDYIFKSLRWPLCLRPGPMAAVLHGLARVFNDVVKDMYWLRDQFNPATCELDNLAPLAESRGITRHRLEVDDDKFRGRVVKAFAWQLLGGKSVGMPKLLEHFGYAADEPINVRGEDATRWAEFRLELDSPPAIGQDDYELLLWSANEAKPARSKLESVRFRATLESPSYTGGAVRFGSVQHIPVQFNISSDPVRHFSGAGVREADIIHISLSDSDIAVSPVGVYFGGVVQVTDTITIGGTNA